MVLVKNTLAMTSLFYHGFISLATFLTHLHLSKQIETWQNFAHMLAA